MTRLILLFLAASALCASAEEVSFTVTPPASGVLGTPLQLDIEAGYPVNLAIRPDTTTLASESFHIISFSTSPVKTADGIAYQITTFNILPLDVGISTFPALIWHIAGPEKRQIKSPEAYIKIDGVIAKSIKEPELKDIRPPFAVIALWPFIVCAALLVILLAWLWKRKKDAAYLLSAPPVDTRSPEAFAAEELEILLQSGIWLSGEYKLFYEKLSDLLRTYIFRRFGLQAHMMTSSDLLRNLKTLSLPVETATRTRSFFESCDLVKFAKLKPGEKNKDNDCEIFRSFVSATTPVRTSEEPKVPE